MCYNGTYVIDQKRVRGFRQGFQTKSSKISVHSILCRSALTLVYPGLSRYQWIKYSIPLRFCYNLDKLFPSSATWRHGYQSRATTDYCVIDSKVFIFQLV